MCVNTADTVAGSSSGSSGRSGSSLSHAIGVVHGNGQTTTKRKRILSMQHGRASADGKCTHGIVEGHL